MPIQFAKAHKKVNFHFFSIFAHVKFIKTKELRIEVKEIEIKPTMTSKLYTKTLTAVGNTISNKYNQFSNHHLNKAI